jgi:hypothetical protein
LEKQI